MSTQPGPDEKPCRKPSESSKEKDESVGWIEALAKRSAGLPETHQPSQEPKKDPAKSPWSYAGIGLQFAATTALFAFMGMYVDRRMGWSPWATVGLTLLGLIGGLYLLIKDALKNNADPPSKGPKK